MILLSLGILTTWASVYMLWRSHRLSRRVSAARSAQEEAHKANQVQVWARAVAVAPSSLERKEN